MGILDRKPEMGPEPELIKLLSCSPSSLELLQAIYRSAAVPLHTRIRCAVAALPFEHPKLAVTAILPDDGRFAEQLEKALARSGQVLELRANGSQFEMPPPTVAVRRR